MSYAIVQKEGLQITNIHECNEGYDEQVGGLIYQMKWDKFKQMVHQCGFRIGYLRHFIGHGWSYNGGKTEEEEIIFYNRKNGLVLYANSFNSTAINQAVLCGEIVCTSFFSGKQKALIAHCSTIKKSGNMLSFSMEVGKGFKHYVTKLEENFKFCTPWSVEKDFIFANYMERENSDITFWQSCTQKKLQQCNNELSAIMHK